MNKRLIALVALFITFSAVYATCVAVGNWLFPEVRWELADINAMLDVPVPVNASNIEIDGIRSRAYESLDLSFSASEVEAVRFAKQFCGGVLYTGYDPFNAVDSKSFLPNSHEIIFSRFRYYSVSLNTRPATSGNRCLLGGAPIHIRVDTSNSVSTNVRFHMFQPCGDGCEYEGIVKNNASVH